MNKEKTIEEMNPLTKEVIDEERNPSDDKNSTRKNYSMMVDLIHTMEDNVKTLEDSVKNQLHANYNLKEDVLDVLLPYKKEDIKTVPVEEYKKIVIKYYDAFTKDAIEAHKEKLDDLTDDEIYDMILELKKMSIMIISAKKECENIKKDSAEVLDEYLNYLNSNKVKDIRLKNLKMLKEAVQNEPDLLKKKRMEKKIQIMEASMNFQFLFTPFEKNKEKEVNAIKDGYFNDKKGNYIIGKYTSKIKQFGFDPKIYRYFLNIEENFCDKKYSPFNNLFLFIYMRIVGYADFYNEEQKMYVHALTGALADLVYHKFETGEEEKNFVKVIEKVLDYFMDDIEEFKENNTTWEGHPVRKEQEAAHDNTRKVKLTDKLKELKYDKEIPENATANELQEIFDAYVDKLIDEQAEIKANTPLDQLNKAKEVNEVADECEEEANNILTDIVAQMEDSQILDYLDTTYNQFKGVELDPELLDEE